MTLFAVGLMLGLVAGLILAALAIVHFDRLENPSPWTSSDQWTTTETEYAPQRDDVLGRILADIEREKADPLSELVSRGSVLQADWYRTSFGPARWRISDDLAWPTALLHGGGTFLGWFVFVDHDLPPGSLVVEPDPVELERMARERDRPVPDSVGRSY